MISLCLRRKTSTLIWLLTMFYAAALLSSLWVEQSILRQQMAQTATNRRGNVLIAQSNPKTLALLSPPGLVGGFRNQVIRLVALVRHAQQNNMSQLLLPTILFSTTYHGQSNKLFFPIAMEDVFDIEHWNSYSSELPYLAPLIHRGDCWSTNTSTISNSSDFDYSIYNSSIRKVDNPSFQSPMATSIVENNPFLTPISHINKALLKSTISIPKPRKLDLTPLVEHCSHPYVYGGGKGAGKLWNDFTRMPKYDPQLETNSPAAIQNSKLIASVSQALQPNIKWKQVAHQCISHHQQQRSRIFDHAPYVALHARVEVIMMNHRCGKYMEKNLTSIFNFVESMVMDYNKNNFKKLEGVFVAVSREGMLEHTSNKETQQVANGNYQTLVRKSQSSIQANKDNAIPEVPFFECGELWMDQFYASQNQVPNDYYGSLVPSVLNFYLATRAAIFVGVAGSSWSTDVWMARYHQGKGATNYEYTPQGIIPVPNNGLPPSHDNCSNHTKTK